MIDSTGASASELRTLDEILDRYRKAGQCLVVPGVYDALSARICESVGFEAVYLTGAGYANSALGMPDVGLVTVTELRDHVARTFDATDVPLIVDADTGFGNAINVGRTVRLLERAGAAALQMEDQVFPKRCGHFDGKAIISRNEMVQKIHAAVDARDSESTLIIARTDARQVSGLDDALDRAQAYREAGADVLFVEAPEGVSEIDAIATRFAGVPLMLNLVEGGKTPLVETNALGEKGYVMALYANAALRAAQRAVTSVMTALRKSGTTTGVIDSLASWEERQEMVGKTHFDLLEQKYAWEG
jgi:2-methylisocitrate lyase-like PEP mutase family enzyme